MNSFPARFLFFFFSLCKTNVVIVHVPCLYNVLPWLANVRCSWNLKHDSIICCWPPSKKNCAKLKERIFAFVKNHEKLRAGKISRCRWKRKKWHWKRVARLCKYSNPNTSIWENKEDEWSLWKLNLRCVWVFFFVVLCENIWHIHEAVLGR